MRANTFAGQVIAVLSRRASAFELDPTEPQAFPGRINALFDRRRRTDSAFSSARTSQVSADEQSRRRSDHHAHRDHGVPLFTAAMMSERGVFFWLVVGGIISMMDCWLSIQFMFGVIAPSNTFSLVAAVVGGLSLTMIAVVAPIIMDKTTAPVLWILWFIVLLIDIGTSILGVIWYGVMSNPLNSMIVFSEIVISSDQGSWLETVVFLTFVLIVAGCCFKFGQALNVLNYKYHAREHSNPGRR